MSTAKEVKTQTLASSSKKIDGITLHHLTCNDKEEIAMHLDVDSKWKFVAEAIGMKTKKILWIPCRQNPRGSETLGFLGDLESKEVTLEQFIEAINNSSCQVLSVINLLNRRYPEIKEKYHQEIEKKYHQEKLVGVHLMISVADCLLNNGFNVSINKQEQFLSLKKENLMKIQKLLNAVDWTVLLVSPTFLDTIKKMSNLDMDDPNIISLYITEMVKEAQSKENTKLSRSIVVLLDGAKKDTLPKWMRNLKVFQWSDDYQSLLLHITSAEELLWKLKKKREEKNVPLKRKSPTLLRFY